MQYKLSIIVPAYNVESYLPQCLESILAQIEGKPVEVVLVDDGSTDGTGEIVEMCAAENLAVHECHQANAGLSAARNRGIAMASGEYLQFVDGDDWLEPGAVDTILAALWRRPDALLMNLNRYDDGELASHSEHSAAMLAGGLDGFLNDVISKTPICSMAQCLLVKSSLVKSEKLQFHEGVLHEDLEWTPLVLCAAHTLEVLEEPVYAYRRGRPGSIMKSPDYAQHTQSCLEVARVLSGTATRYPEPRKGCLLRNAGFAVFRAMHYAYLNGDEARKAAAQEIKQDVLLAEAAQHLPKRFGLCCTAMGLARGIVTYEKHWPEV